MNEKDFADCIRLMRRAPLSNMNEAEAAAELIQRFSKFASEYLEELNDVEQSPGGTS